MAKFTLGERLTLVSYLSRSNRPELQDIIQEQKELIQKRGQELAESDFVQLLLSAAEKGDTKAEVESSPIEDLSSEGIHYWKERFSDKIFVFWS